MESSLAKIKQVFETFVWHLLFVDGKNRNARL